MIEKRKEAVKEWFRKNFSKVKFFDAILWKNYLYTVGIISSFITLISFLGTANELKINVKVTATIFVLILIIIFVCQWWNANHKNCAKLRINNTNIVIQQGDIF